MPEAVECRAVQNARRCRAEHLEMPETLGDAGAVENAQRHPEMLGLCRVLEGTRRHPEIGECPKMPRRAPRYQGYCPETLSGDLPETLGPGEELGAHLESPGGKGDCGERLGMPPEHRQALGVVVVLEMLPGAA
ncbi:UNVERIFIED_CONTAM: hypothetical protein K2H54_053157 [Gekko kuhli]